MKKTHKIKIPKTAHYYTIGEATKATECFWIACHGYGQSASTFIHKFDGLDTNKHFVLAPEALSRFYWDNRNNIVGASWMTRMDRLDEIADYSRYLQALYDKYLSQMNPNVKIILFGFSQGCATQVRWIMNNFPKFDTLILWAGLLPEDLDYTPHTDYFNSKKIFGVYGHEDQFINSEKLEWQSGFAQAQKLEMEVISFEGKHKVDRTVLYDLAGRIIS